MIAGNMASSTLFVSNFPFTTTDSELRAAFEPLCRVESLRIITDRSTGKSRGFAFIEVPGGEDVSAAIETLNESTWNGRRLVVSRAHGPDSKAPNAKASSKPSPPFRHQIVIQWSDEAESYAAEVPDLGLSAHAPNIHDAVRRVQTLTKRTGTEKS